MFADDAVLVFVHENFDDIVSHITNCLKLFFDWCYDNMLSINPSKSEYMIVSNRKIPYDPIFVIKTEPIIRKSAVTYLGLWIDDRLMFSCHVD